MLKGATWDIKVVVAVDLAAVAQGKCSRRLARNAKRNAKFLSSLAKTVRSIARTVSQSAKIAVARTLDFV
jgi:hypothetical protein